MRVISEQSPVGREVELKLEISSRDRECLTAAVQALGEPTQVTMLTSVYFDNPEQALRKAGLSLRVRHDGDRRVQTVKADGASAGLFDRPEWEFDIGGDTPDLTNDHSPLGHAIGRKALRRMAPVFRTLISRSKTLADIEGATVELVIDQGKIVAADRAVTVCELELELKHGTTASLFALARRLDETGAVRLGVLSKSERGYLLLTPKVAGPFRADAVLLDSEMTAAAAFRAIAWSCLRHYRLNEDLLIATGDADALHQARVALRRLRSGFSMFKSVVDDDYAPRLRGELRWLAGVLGEARNIDVLVPQARGAALRKRLLAGRKRAYRTVTDVLASPRVRRLMLDLAEWLTLGAEKPVMRGDPMALDFAIGRLERLRNRLKKAAAHFDSLPDDDRHEVRIEAKKLRYATEFFTSLFPGKKAGKRHKQFREALESFQGVLGDLNDQVTGRHVLAQLGLGDVAADAWHPPADRGDLIAQGIVAHRALLDIKRFWY